MASLLVMEQHSYIYKKSDFRFSFSLGLERELKQSFLEFRVVNYRLRTSIIAIARETR